MAFKRSINLQNGISTDEGYIKIDTIEGGKNLMYINVCYYLNTESMLCISSGNFIFKPDLNSPDNFIKQAYCYLKTLDEFKDAIDC